MPGHPARNLTNGQTDGTGAWAPTWSPDGARLAFVSTRGSAGVSLWIWERAQDRLRQVGTPGIRYDDMWMWNAAPFQWLDRQRIVCFVESRGGVSRLETRIGRNARLGTSAWDGAERGELTVSVLKSNEFRTGESGVWVVDVDNDTGRRVGEAALPIYPVATTWLAPDGRTMAVARPIASAYNFQSAIRMGFPVSLELLSLDEKRPTFKAPLPANVHAMTLAWSPDGKEVAFFANGEGPIDPIVLYGTAAAAAMPIERPVVRGNPARLYRANVEQGTVASWGTGDIDLGAMGSPEFFWTAAGDLVFHVPRRQYGVASGPPPSRGAPWGASSSNAVPIYPAPPAQWWVLDRTGKSRLLVPEGTSVPTSLQPVDGGRRLVGVRDGDVWSIEPSTAAVTNLTGHFAPRVSSIALATGSPTSGSQLIIRADSTPETSEATHSASSTPRNSYYDIDLKRSTTTALKEPGRSAALRTFAPRTQSAAYVISDREGLQMWRTTAEDRTPELLLETNTHLREIEPPTCQMISYSSLNGEPLQAWLCLPPGAVAGRRYPTIVEVRYGARRTGGAYPLRLTKMEIFTSAGYAYLWPSIPAMLPDTLPEESDSPVMALNGTLPAVEAAVSLGVADPKRVFITGASRGGWTVLATIGLTTRFAAAISEAYGDGARVGALDHNPADRFVETGEMRRIDPNGGVFKAYRPSDVPWWRDGDMFRRNHPLTYVDRVKTPVMLVHGDLDEGAPVDGSEDYFFALVSMRKSAELVRYWGEGHSNRIPANVRDVLQRSLAWFDRWGDIRRDVHGEMMFDGKTVRSREGAPPLPPEFFAKVGPAAPTSAANVTASIEHRP